MIRGASALALAAAGCFSVPPFEPEGGVTYTAAGTGGIVSAPGFALRFADGPGFHFPDSLMIGSTEVFGTDGELRCYEEDGVGLTLAPAPRISASSGAVPEANSLEAVLRGPAVVQVKLTWSTRLDCMPIVRNPTGTSTFTAFPDGRIVRHDTLTDPVTMEVSAASCACDSSGSGLFKLSMFWTLVQQRFRILYYGTPEQPQEQQLPDTGEITSGFSTSCADAEDFEVSFAWSDVAGTRPAIRGGDALLTFLRELTPGQPVNIGRLEHTSSSALLIGRDDCTKGLTRAVEHAVPSPLTINDDTVVSPSPLNGIYGDAAGVGEPLDLGGRARATIKGLVPTPFAVWLRFPRPVDGIRARRQNVKGAWYLPQQVDPRSWIVWFRDPIVDLGDTIDIEPR